MAGLKRTFEISNAIIVFNQFSVIIGLGLSHFLEIGKEHAPRSESCRVDYNLYASAPPATGHKSYR